MVRPREIIAVDVTAREWPLSIRTGVMRVGVSAACPEEVEGSADRIANEKSTPAVRTTRDEGKNWMEVTVLRCGLPMAVAMTFLLAVGTMQMDPSP